MRQSMVMEAKKIWEKISMTGSVQNLQFEIELQKNYLTFFTLVNSTTTYLMSVMDALST